ncbi:MAG TPA: amidohydrolase family protein [Steroidobacteraceae bacterium]|nr:amidohydrolase family protein [Steroidobacteraceae bacterium]
MRRVRLLGAVAAALLACTAAQAAAPGAANAVIHAGRLLAVPGRDPVTNATVVVADGKVREIRPGFVEPGALGLPPDTAVIDLRNMFVMPGFIDLHVHLSSSGLGGGRDLRLREAEGYFSLIGARSARATLMAGFTTVRDLGSEGSAIYALRDAERDGIVVAPKIIVSGDPISPTNGHADNHNLREEVMRALPRRGVCDGADECRRVVREAIRRGADVIKVMATGGTLDESNAGTGQQFTDEELKAIADTAHAFGRKVTAHAHAKAGIDACVRAGFDSIEHGMWADDKTLREMKAKGIWLVPTVATITFVGDTPEKIKAGPLKDLPPVSLEKVLKLGTQPRKLARLAHEIGTKIALGTDAPLVPHGQNATEMIEYVNAGMTPMEALMTGTVNAAEAAGVADKTGSLEAGKAADLVALSRSPLENIKAVMDVAFVMRDGVVVKGPGAVE